MGDQPLSFNTQIITQREKDKERERERERGVFPFTIPSPIHLDIIIIHILYRTLLHIVAETHMSLSADHIMPENQS